MKFLVSKIAAVIMLAMAPMAASAADLTLSGSTTVVKTIMTPYSDDLASKTGLSLEVVGNGSGNGVKDLEAGKTDVAMISSPLENVITKANNKKPGSISGDDLQAHPIGGTKMFVIVNKSNPVASSLTEDQVRAILKGELSNWSEVGGPNAAIQIFSERAGGGARATLEKSFLKGDLSPKTKPVNSVALGVKVTGQNPNAISYAGRKLLDNNVVVIENIAIEQPLWLITKGDPSPDVAKLIAAAAEIGNSL